VELRPLRLEDAEGLYAAFAIDEATWRWLPRESPRDVAAMATLLDAQLAKQAKGETVVFTQVEAKTGLTIGSTSILDIRVADDGVEVGATWLGRPWQRTGINREAKLLLLGHLFEELGAMRVQLKTDTRNVQSQTAIERLGAVREGVLRKHMRLWDGHVRDTVMYSILDAEWPAVKAALTR
jgi:RimJ/RimL family protein N-acetyltransferase